MNIHGSPFGEKISFHGGLSTSMVLSFMGVPKTSLFVDESNIIYLVNLLGNHGNVRL